MLTHFFVLVIYQPFFNLLLGIYWLLLKLPGSRHADMGVAVIIFTLALRFLMLPLTLSGQRTANERREIEEQIKAIKQQHKDDPIQERQAIKQVMRTNHRIVIAEVFGIFIQVAIALMLWRIFARGLLGADFHLIYSFMPSIAKPLDLTFMDRFDLTHPSLILNLIQSFIIFAVESLSVLTNPYPMSRKEAFRMQLIMPVASFMIFALLPAGKKLFVITTLIFSFCFMLITFIIQKLNSFLSPGISTAKSTNKASIAS